MNHYREIYQPIKHDWYLDFIDGHTYQICRYCGGHPDTVEDIDGECDNAKYYVEKIDIKSFTIIFVVL